jgi:uncharacterized membrane protein
MFCDRCGTAVEANAAQCPRCQAPLSGVALVPAAVPRGAGAWIADGWNAVTANFWTFVLLGLILIAAGSTVPILIQAPVAMGLQWAALRQVATRRAEVNDVTVGFNLFPQAVMISLVTTILITAGFILLILPGIAACVLLQFPYLLALDRKLDFWAAIKESFNVSQRHFGSLLGLWCLQIAIIVGGALLCGVGLLAALPMVYTSSASAYIDLFGLQNDTRTRLAGAPAP